MLKNYAAACLLATALTAAPAFAQNSTNPSTQDFVHNAAIGGMFEIQSSQLALKKSQDKDVRQAAQQIIDDHRKADDRLKSLAKGETVPSNLDSAHEQMLTKLQGENGSNFVDQWKQDQVQAHNQAIQLFEAYGKNGSDSSLKQFASQTVPTLQHHLQLVDQISVASANGNHSQQMAANGGFLTDETPGTWRASKVIGLGVYNAQDQKVGTINEVLFGRDGRVEAAVIGVGGFLGLGERDVAVPYQQLKWSMKPVQSTMANANPAAETNPNATGTTAAGTTGAGLGNSGVPMMSATPMGANSTAEATNTTAAPNTTPNNTMANNTMANNTGTNAGNKTAAYPDHAILADASKDQLQKAPQFNYGTAPR